MLMVVSIKSTIASSSEPHQCPGIDTPGHPVFYRDAVDFSTFYVCVQGVAQLRICPESLHFNEKLQQCDYPVEADL